MQLEREKELEAESFIQTNVSLADKNWFRTGGKAAYWAAPKTALQMKKVMAFAFDRGLPYFMLGSGANILISDKGFGGLVICPRLHEIFHQPIDGNKVLLTAGAGVTLNDLIVYSLHNSLSGLEEFSGIPGTVGGAVFINLHYFEYLLSDFLVSARVLHVNTQEISTVDTAWFSFGYNSSKLHDRDYILLDATFCVAMVNEQKISYAWGRRDEIIRHRAKRYPTQSTCGSFFRNFYENEVSLEVHGKKVIWVAYYLDRVGVKGDLSVGNASVSHQHANMIVNKGDATAADIVILAREMQKRVWDQFRLLPQPECQLVGFSEYPLLKEEDVL